VVELSIPPARLGIGPGGTVRRVASVGAAFLILAGAHAAVWMWLETVPMQGPAPVRLLPPPAPAEFQRPIGQPHAVAVYPPAESPPSSMPRQHVPALVAEAAPDPDLPPFESFSASRAPIEAAIPPEEPAVQPPPLRARYSIFTAPFRFTKRLFRVKPTS
jgi:hypothetical protein